MASFYKPEHVENTQNGLNSIDEVNLKQASSNKKQMAFNHH